MPHRCLLRKEVLKELFNEKKGITEVFLRKKGRLWKEDPTCPLGNEKCNSEVFYGNERSSVEKRLTDYCEKIAFGDLLWKMDISKFYRGFPGKGDLVEVFYEKKTSQDLP